MITLILFAVASVQHHSPSTDHRQSRPLSPKYDCLKVPTRSWLSKLKLVCFFLTSSPALHSLTLSHASSLPGSYYCTQVRIYFARTILHLL